MSLGSDPSRVDIVDEFGSNTATSPINTVGSLQECYLLIFGSPASNYSRTAFANKGQPTGTTNPATGVQQTEANLNGNISFYGNIECKARFEIADNFWFIGSSLTSEQTFNSNASVIETVDDLDPDTTYYYRLILYNGFNSHSSDWFIATGQSFSTEPAPEPTPYNPTASQPDPTSGEILAEWDIDYTNLPMEVEWERNGSFWAFDSVSAGETSTTRMFGNTNNVRFRVRYTSTGGTGANTSFGSWSNTVQVNIIQ